MGKTINITEQRFGFWVAKKPGEKNKNGQTQWLCVCECGKEKLVTLNSLRTGNSTSCGCNHAPNLHEKKFGKLLVLKIDVTKTGGRRHWECQCRCGNLITATTYQLRNKIVTSCGRCPSEKSVTKSIITTLSCDDQKYPDHAKLKEIIEAKLNDLRILKERCEMIDMEIAQTISNLYPMEKSSF
jgi:hypothetical protein